MYCVQCGSALSNQSQFCSNCGSRRVFPEKSCDPDSQGTPPQANEPEGEDRKIAEKAGAQQSEVSPSPQKFEKNIRRAVSALAGSAASEEAKPHTLPRYANVGAIIMGAFAFICGILFAFSGLTPIFLAEAVAFGALAWLCAVRWPLSQRVHAIVLICSLLIAGLVGVTLDQDIFGTRVRYPSVGPPRVQPSDQSKALIPPPDKGGTLDSYLACVEADSLAKLCTERSFVPSKGSFAEYGGYEVPLPSLTPVPEGFKLEPNQKDCDTAFQWNNYCHTQKKYGREGGSAK
jgi:hypothetical protein